MAGSDEKRETRRERVVPNMERGSSRVSRAAGELGSQSMQAMNSEQRTGSSRQNGRSSSAKPSARIKSSQSGASSQSGRPSQKQGPKRSAVPVTPPSSATRRAKGAGPDNPKDTQFINWARSKWSAMEAHQQQRIFGVLALALTLLLFLSLTFLHNAPILKGINGFFLTFFGWASYPLAIGLVAFAVAHLYEGIKNQRHLLRSPMVIGLVVIWLLVLIESRLIMGPMKVGVLAELLVTPLTGWGPVAPHVVTLGLLLITIILTFRITFGHVLIAARTVRRLLTNEQQPALGAKQEGPSQYRGQRPRFSRYTAGAANDPQDAQASRGIPARASRAALQRGGTALQIDDEDDEDEEYEDEEVQIDFDADFEDDDPLNDINIHKQQVGLVPKGGARGPQPLDLSNTVVQGASQQALPFDKAASSKKKAKEPTEMEPLAPNPLHALIAKARGGQAPNIVSAWKLPEVTLLNSPETAKIQILGDDTGTLARTIQETLRSFRVDAEVKESDISIGPTVIRFGIRPTGKPEMKKDLATGKMVPVRDAAGNLVYESRTRVSRIMALQNDLALVLEAKTIRMEAPVPGRPYVGVEIPNKNSRLVTLREVLESKEYQAVRAKSKLAVALGKDVAGLVRIADLAKMPHALIAGATGAGKSVMINTIIASILTQATPDDVRLLMVDPKMVELNMYNGIPHLLSPVVTEVDNVVGLLKNAITEMERRYRSFSQLGVRNLDGYRKLRMEKLSKGDTSLINLPAIVIIIDELADLMMAAPEEVEGMICRLAQLARATGIHLVIATQRPSVDVITGLIKANIPTRISFMVSSAVDSRTIIDMGGAERLLGRGDMLYLPADAGRPERIQAAFLADEEAETLANYWRQQIEEHQRKIARTNPEQAQAPKPLVEPGWEIKEASSDEFELDDDLLDKAEDIVREYGRASISLLQRRLRIGYSRAARLIDLLEERGIIGQSERGGKAREILDGNGSYDRRGGGEGHTMADAVADIVAEERARDEFLRKQAAANRMHSPHSPRPQESENE